VSGASSDFVTRSSGACRVGLGPTMWSWTPKACAPLVATPAHAGACQRQGALLQDRRDRCSEESDHVRLLRRAPRPAGGGAFCAQPSRSGAAVLGSCLGPCIASRCVVKPRPAWLPAPPQRAPRALQPVLADRARHARGEQHAASWVRCGCGGSGDRRRPPAAVQAAPNHPAAHRPA
jgi:hypothetical protein